VFKLGLFPHFVTVFTDRSYFVKLQQVFIARQHTMHVERNIVFGNPFDDMTVHSFRCYTGVDRQTNSFYHLTGERA